MLNIDALKKAANEVGAVLIDKASKASPMMFSNDKKFANGYTLVLALMVAADREVEAEETIGVLNLIQKANAIRDLNLVSEALGYYTGFIEDISEYFGENQESAFLVRVASLLEENIGEIREAEHINALISLVQAVAGVKPDVDEKAMAERIEEALRRQLQIIASS